MLTLSLDIYLTRLPRARCDQCRRRRVLYVIGAMPCHEHHRDSLGDTISSVARCAKCLGIGK